MNELLCSEVFEVDGSRDGNSWIIIFDDRSSFPGKSQSYLKLYIGVNEWTDKVRSSRDIIHGFPRIPRVFERVDIESETFHIHIIRKKVNPITICIIREGPI